MAAIPNRFTASLSFHLLISAIVFTAVYSPVAVFPFQKHDDFWIQQFPPVDNCRKSPEYEAGVGAGRILQSETTRCLIYPVYARGQDSKLFLYLRLINLLCIILAAGMMSWWAAVACRINSFASQIISILIFTLPGFQILLCNGFHANQTFSIVLVMLAVLVLKDKDINGRWPKGKESGARKLLSYLLLIITLFTYQSNAFLFLLPSVLLVISADASDWERRKIIILRHLVILTLSIGVYYFIQKLVIAPAYLHYYPEAQYSDHRFDLALEHPFKILQKMIFAFFDIKAFNLWLASDLLSIARIPLVFLAVTAALFLLAEGSKILKKQSSSKNKVFFIQAVLVLCYIYLVLQSPLLTKGGNPHFRSIVFYSAFIVLLLVWCMEYWLKILFKSRSRGIFNGLIFLAAMASAVLAQAIPFRDCALLSMQEIDYLEQKIQPLLNGDVSTVYIRRPKHNTRIHGDEFSMLTSFPQNTYGLRGLVTRIYLRNGKDPSVLDFKDMASPVIRVTDLKVQSKDIRGSISLDLNDFLRRISQY